MPCTPRSARTDSSSKFTVALGFPRIRHEVEALLAALVPRVHLVGGSPPHGVAHGIAAPDAAEHCQNNLSASSSTYWHAAESSCWHHLQATNLLCVRLYVTGLWISMSVLLAGGSCHRMWLRLRVRRCGYLICIWPLCDAGLGRPDGFWLLLFRNETAAASCPCNTFEVT